MLSVIFCRSEEKWTVSTAYPPDADHLMGMENMMLNIAQYPELFKRIMDQAADDTLAYYDLLEEKGLILPTTEYEVWARELLLLTQSCQVRRP